MNHTKGNPGSRKKKRPERMCVVCRERREKKDLLRIVITAEGTYALDPKGELQGRGSYVCADSACIRRGLDRHIFEKSFGKRVPEAFAEELLAEAEKHG